MARRTVPIMQCDKLCYSDNITSIQLRKVLSNWAENANLAILQSAGQGRLLPNIQMGEKLFSKCQCQAGQLAWYCTGFTDDVNCFVDAIVSQIDINTTWILVIYPDESR